MDAKLQLLLTARDMTASAFGTFQRRIQGATRMLTSFSGVIGGIAGIGSLGGMAMMTKRTLDFSDSLAKTADKIGLSTDNLQIYRYAAERSGVATNALDMGMQRFTRRLAEAAQGGGELKGVLEQYGIAVRNSNGAIRTTDAVLDDLAEAIRNAESDSERLRIAFKAFDSEGAALVNMLRGGKQGLDEYRANAQRLGIVIKEDLLRGAENANDAITDLTTQLDTAFKTTILTIAPGLESVAEAVTDWVSSNRELIQQDIPNVFRGIADVGENVASVIATIGQEALWAGKNIGMLGAALDLTEKKDSSKPPWWLRFGALGALPGAWLEKPLEITGMAAENYGALGALLKEYERIEKEQAAAREKGPIRPGIMSEHEMRRLGLSTPLASKPAPAPGVRPWTSGDQFMEDLGLNDFAWFYEAEQVRVDNAVKSHEEYINAVEEGFARHIGSQEKFFQKTVENSDNLVALTERTAWAMQENFSNLFFDAFSGDLKTFEDYFTAAMRSLLKISTDYAGQIAAQFLFGKEMKGGGFLSDVWSAVKMAWGKDGLVYDQNSVKWHARGDILTGPTVFPLRNGSWVGGGEAGTEAIMPLKRGRDGRLGVAADGGGASITLSPVIQISAIDSRSGLDFVRQQAGGIVEVMAEELKHNPAFAKLMRG